MNETMVLDIGTGTVIGLLARHADEGLEILAREERRYPDRVVREGRIVDVTRAANTVQSVVDSLREEVGLSINTAHFAVPGRGLECHRPSETREFDVPREISREDWNRLVRARTTPGGDRVIIDTELSECEVDGELVETPVGQFGRRIRAEWMLTSIPMREIENKRNVITTAGLVPGQVLLESRAAMRASVPSADYDGPMAILDFGAGTIDAAYLEEGRVRDYVTFLGSGDELTRRIERDCHVGFHVAEDIKASAGQNEIQYRSLSGDNQLISREELEGLIIPVLRDQVEQLEEWFEDRDPGVVFLAGGGSQFEFLDRLVSRLLNIDEENIVSGSPSMPSEYDDERGLVGSPADYTALGILLLINEERGHRYLRLTVNGDPFARLVDTDEYTAGDLCRELGYREREPLPDSAMMVSIDGDWRTFRAQNRLRPVVEVDGERVEEHRVLRSGADVDIEPAEPPQPVEVHAKDCLPDDRLTVVFEGSEYDLRPALVDKDGHDLTDDDPLQDGREYELRDEFTPGEVLDFIAESGTRPPDVPLWLIDGQYATPDSLAVGQSVTLVAGRPVNSTGLGRLGSLPEENVPVERALD